MTTHKYFLVRTPNNLTEADVHAALEALSIRISAAPLGAVKVSDVSGNEPDVFEVDRLYNVEDDYDSGDELRTEIGDDLYDAFSDLVPGPEMLGKALAFPDAPREVKA